MIRYWISSKKILSRLPQKHCTPTQSRAVNSALWPNYHSIDLLLSPSFPTSFFLLRWCKTISLTRQLKPKWISYDVYVWAGRDGLISCLNLPLLVGWKIHAVFHSADDVTWFMWSPSKCVIAWSRWTMATWFLMVFSTLTVVVVVVTGLFFLLLQCHWVFRAFHRHMPVVLE